MSSDRLRARAGELPVAFWWLWLGTLINRAGTFIEPFFVLYLTGPRHVPVSTTGAVLTVWGLGSVASQPIGGFCTDRFGRRATLAGSLVTTAAGLMLLGLARPLWLITVLVFALGLVADMYRPASMAAVADLVPDERRRVRAYALQFWAINLGFSIASTSAGLLLHLGFPVLFGLDAATTLAFGLLALRFVPESRPVTDHAPARFADPLRLLAQDRLLLGTTLVILVYAVIYLQVNIVLPLAIVHEGLSPSDYGYVIAVNGVLIVVGQPLTLGLIERWPRRLTLPAGLAIVTVGVSTTGLCRSGWEFALSVVVWTSGEILTAGSSQVLVASLAPAHQRGRYAGAIGLAWGASGLLGPLLGASGYAFSPALVWTFCLVSGLLAAAAQFRLVSAVEERNARRDQPVTSAASDGNGGVCSNM